MVVTREITMKKREGCQDVVCHPLYMGQREGRETVVLQKVEHTFTQHFKYNAHVTMVIERSKHLD